MTTAAKRLTNALNAACHCSAADVPTVLRDIELRADGSLVMAQSHATLFSTQPYFVEQADVRDMRNIIKAIENITARPDYQQLVLERSPLIAGHDPKSKGVFLGYDFHLTSMGPKLIEINTNAGGALLNVQLLRQQLACCDDAAQLTVNSDPTVIEQRLMAMFASEWRHARGDQQLRTLAIVDESPRDQYLYPEFLLFKRLFEAQGLTVVLADPNELQFDGRAMRHDRLVIDLIYNRHTDFYLETPALRQLRAAYAADAVVVTPHPRAHSLYADKRNLIWLSDRDFLRKIDVDERTIETLAEGIPQTLPVDRADGERWWAQRKDWFFKPARSFGSRGVYRGDKLTRRAFTSILDCEYVAQRLVQPSERSDVHGARYKVDVRNYVYDSEVQLIGTRLYQGQTTNFRTQGGGFAPTFVIADRTDALLCPQLATSPRKDSVE